MKKRLWLRLIYIAKQAFINNTIRVLEIFLKKDYNYWIFGLCGSGGIYINAYYFYEYIKETKPNLKIICITDRDDVVKRVKDLGGEVCRANSWRAFAACLKAGVCILSHEMAYDMINFSKRNTRKINLFHGVALKKIQYGSQKIRESLKNKSLKSRLVNKLCGYVRHEEYNFIAAVSERYQKIMAEAFNNPKVYITGQPRNDLFYKIKSREKILEKYNLGEVMGKKIVVYMPTFRDTKKETLDYFVFENDVDLKNKLKEKNVVILQKEHHLSSPQKSDDKVIYKLSDEVDPQELLYIANILITDYSSCYIDFLHTLRPIIFYPYDLDNYLAHDREMYFDYNDEVITPGRKVINEKELFGAIKEYLEDSDKDLEKRQKSLKFFYEFFDGKSSKRVYEAINQIINTK